MARDLLLGTFWCVALVALALFTAFAIEFCEVLL